MYGGSDLVHNVKMRTAVHLLELVDAEDHRASQCPAGQRLLRVAGGRDQVGKQSAVKVRISGDGYSIRSASERHKRNVMR